MNENHPQLWSAVDFAHLCLERYVKPNGRLVDATAGNGHDALFLLDLLDDHGELLALDIQQAAVELTMQRLQHHKRSAQAEVLCANHAALRTILQSKGWNAIHGAVMNCGYLPGGDKAIRTDALSTVAAVKTLVEFCAHEGVIVIVCYVGHEGGTEECDRVEDCIRVLPKEEYQSAVYSNQGRNNAPRCYVIQRR